MKTIKSALISVFHKENLAPIVKKLDELGVLIYSTGGTQKYIEEMGVAVNRVEDLTEYPSILGGRVKTLHPKVFGGILARRHEKGDVEQLSEYKIPEIDLTIVDLYPFEKTVASTDDEQVIIEKIDIGGISLIRAAAKNFKDTVVISSQEQYGDLLDILETQGAATTKTQRKYFAQQAFNVSSHYDTAIFNYFNQEFNEKALKISMPQSKELRYGENPHQAGTFYGDLDEMFEKLNGKPLSYNNLVDIDAAVQLIAEFLDDDPTFAILKHTNACGLATRSTLSEAWDAALAGDNVSAFGGILICNTTVDVETAEKINKLFFEVIIAPKYDEAAIDVLKQKKNRVILQQRHYNLANKLQKTLLNGVIEQDRDIKMETKDDLSVATKSHPTETEIEDLLFANKAVKHLKSNTIVLAKNGQLIGMGCGQTSRIDALKQAITKAGVFGFDVAGSVMASDAFFPFSDCVETAHQSGIRAVIQPGGSIRDKDSIGFCDENGMTMVFTGTRHFKH